MPKLPKPDLVESHYSLFFQNLMNKTKQFIKNTEIGLDTKLKFLERFIRQLGGEGYFRIERSIKKDFRDLLNEWHSQEKTKEYEKAFNDSRKMIQKHLFSKIIDSNTRRVDNEANIEYLVELSKIGLRFSCPTPTISRDLKKMRGAIEKEQNIEPIQVRWTNDLQIQLESDIQQMSPSIRSLGRK